ncbi:Diphthine synthase [Giardia muris]|uniref:diphthine methyl ester synthase n=1 Tax=Giardia muris TaxID=5742 RepID=A0A4Z1T2Q5_GIAMU|nr:Diphthine synthase [Giardia muris]|eukprot:TNJ26701.1 Diphthine synthase [Giardia muris]
MLILVGLGLTPESISVGALRAVQACDTVFLDAYTSILVSYDDMKHLVEEVLQRTDVVQCDRRAVEQGEDDIIDAARHGKAAFLVAGDVFCATTHTNLFTRACDEGIEVAVYHNASIISAISCTGLDIYRFGRVVTVPLFTESWRPASFLLQAEDNYRLDLHTLTLLQMSTRELDIPKLVTTNIEVYNDPYYLYPGTAARQILELLQEGEGSGVFGPKSLIVICCRVGTPTQRLFMMTLEDCASTPDDTFGAPMFSLVFIGQHVSEPEFDMLKHAEATESTLQLLRGIML